MIGEPFSMSDPTTRLSRIAILWRGDETARRSAGQRPAGSGRLRCARRRRRRCGPVVYEDDVPRQRNNSPRSMACRLGQPDP
jgi:hypothetical protein